MSTPVAEPTKSPQTSDAPEPKPTLSAAVKPAPDKPKEEPKKDPLKSGPKDVAPTGDPKPDDTKATPQPKEIDEVKTLEDAIAVKLGEKKVREKTPAGDDPELEDEISKTTASLSREQQEAFRKKTYELRDAKRKVKEAEALAAEKAALEQKVKDLEALKGNSAELDEATKTKLAEYEKIIAANNIEQSAIFKREIGEPLAEAEKIALEAIKNSEQDEAEALAALRDTGPDRSKKLNELLANMAEFDKVEFVEAARKIASLNAKKVTMLADAKATLEAQTEQSKKAQELADAERREAWDAAQPLGWKSITEMVPDLKPVENNKDWNDALANAEKFARYKFDDFEISSQVELLQRAGAFPLLAGLVNHQKSQIAELEESLSKYRKAAPAATGDSAGDPPKPNDDRNETFEQRVSRKLREKGITD